MRERRAGLGLREPALLSARPQTDLRAHAWDGIMEDQTGPKDDAERKRASMTQTLIHWLADDDIHNLIILVALILLGIWIWLR